MKYIYSSCVLICWLFAGCAALKIDKNLDTPQPLDEELKNVIYYASFAPSGHNTQGWVVEVASNNQWLIKLDSARLLKEVDPYGRESLISVGAFVENMRLAFKAFGYNTEITVNPNPQELSGNPLAATVNFKKDIALPKDLSLIAIMQKRHTDKRNYLDNPLREEDVSSLLGHFGGMVLYFPKGSAEFEYIKQNSYLANERQIFSAAKTGELAQWLRFSDAEAKAKADGLPAEQLNIRGIKKFFYYLVMDRQKAKGKTFAEQSLKMAKDKLENCAGYFIVLGEDKQSVAAGMRLESFWLKAISYSIALHPMSQILEEEGYKQNLEHFLGTKESVQMVLRAGYVNGYGKNNGIRRPIGEIVSFPNYHE